jgi:putative membrane protein
MFTETDQVRIRQAVRDAERRTRGEIVPMVVPRSGRYREAGHMLGLVLSLITLAALLLWDRVGWGEHFSSVAIILAVVGTYGAGLYVGSFPPVIRWLISRQRMDQKVRRRAEGSFYQHGLHRTREGTGILIMMSLLERSVHILADRAINEKVHPSTWHDLIHELVAATREGHATDGLCRTIEKCGDLLVAHFPARPGDNPDELPDDLVQGR